MKPSLAEVTEALATLIDRDLEDELSGEGLDLAHEGVGVLSGSTSDGMIEILVGSDRYMVTIVAKPI